MQLVSMNFHHTSVQGKTLLMAAKESDYLPGSIFLKVAQIFGEKNTNAETAILVAADFIKLLWNQRILQHQRDNLLVAIFHALLEGRSNRPQLIRAFREEVQIRFAVNPIAEMQFNEILNTWLSINLL